MKLILLKLIVSKRADYWKSQARKFCDFCKCWISDNKPSIQFHENGKRHKANVEAKIKDIRKKSLANQKAQSKMDDDIKKMEEAAMKAYMKDVQENPDLTSDSVLKTAKEQKLNIAKALYDESRKTQWHEAKTSDGTVYYWHSNTGESRWDAPAEGFISMKDQSIQKKPTVPKPPKQKHKHKGGKDHKRKFKKTEKKEGAAEKAEAKVEKLGPYPSANPYGKWETIDNRIPQPIDLQLPEPTHFPIKLSQPLPDDEPKVQFVEKSVSSIADYRESSSNADIQFKKRKLNRGNARQRNDDL